MKLKIWHKMIVGLSIPALIAIIGSLLTYGYIKDVKNREGFVHIADDLKEHALEIRRNEKNYLHYRKLDQFEGLNSAGSGLTESISNIAPETIEKIGPEEISTLAGLISEYLDILNRVKTSFQTETEITKQVRDEGKKLEDIVSSKKLAKELSVNFVLRLRLLEKNYMLLRDENSYGELNSVISQINNVTPFCYECEPYINSVRDLFKIYEKSDALTETLHKTGNGLERITGQIAGRERERISSFITHTQRLLLLGLILLCTIGPLFVYKTASYISAPIKRLAEITKKISEGDISLRAPLKEQDESYSLAVSFNKMLDNLQQTQQSLKESLELLNEKQAQLVESEKRASMGFLVAGVAHELNNPLNNISLRADVVSEEIKVFGNEKLTGYVQDIVTQSKRAHNIINNLLDFARARKSAEMEKQDIIRVTRDSLDLVANQLRISNIKLIKEIPDTSYFIIGNRSKLEQILISIISNAIQAMKNEGTLTVAVEPDKDREEILIRISDTGMGIPEADIKNIFQPFFTTKPPGEGTGLGLAVSHTLVTEHKGEIEVESEPGSGTKFTIRLPLFDEKLTEDEETEAQPVDNG